MVYVASRELRECCLAAMSGDGSAAKELLKLYGEGKLAREIQPGKPFSNRIRRAIDVLTAGTNSSWETVFADGSAENLLMTPPPKRKSEARKILLDD
jgi:hypothetical protein